jgi:hypothetical protein
MKETKTARAEPGCPTLLHYLARVLMRADPSLCTFIEEIPHLEPAARGKHQTIAMSQLLSDHISVYIVSVQTVIQSIGSVVAGLSQVNEEIRQLKQLRPSIANDRFIHVMQVISPL